MGSAQPGRSLGREDSAIAFMSMGLSILIVHLTAADPWLFGTMAIMVSLLYWFTGWTEWQIWYRTIVAVFVLGMLLGCASGEDGCPHPSDERVTETTCRHQTVDGWEYHPD